ncbi:hypothetical protein F2P81_020552 [Scophthalmus maximus]|uniref:Uncharacterized protein n=1 Tax=Scophthalmus maximus TaxID=52904 RepID=A0A6A4S9P1_SCOMX|nr:hypothetical protein F2P81_020552 [Scophthalmus maximus]
MLSEPGSVSHRHRGGDAAAGHRDWTGSDGAFDASSFVYSVCQQLCGLIICTSAVRLLAPHHQQQRQWKIKTRRFFMNMGPAVYREHREQTRMNHLIDTVRDGR